MEVLIKVNDVPDSFNFPFGDLNDFVIKKMYKVAFWCGQNNIEPSNVSCKEVGIYCDNGYKDDDLEYDYFEYYLCFIFDKIEDATMLKLKFSYGV